MTQLYTQVDINEQETTKPKSETKRDGLERRYRKHLAKIDYVLQIEKLWERYALALNDHDKEEAQYNLLKQLSIVLKGKARAAGAQWNNSRISAADFESIYFEEAWILCDKYNHYGEFYFYETFLLVLERRGIDLVRQRTKKKQGAFEREVRRLKEEAADFLPDVKIDVEGETLNRLLVTQILNDPSLTELERRLLQTKYEYPNASKAELARAAGLKHHQEVTRILDKVRAKLNDYVS